MDKKNIKYKEHLSYILKLNKERKKFNRLNEDFYSEYYKKTRLGKYFLLRRVRLFKYKAENMGYVWLDKKGREFIIRSLVFNNINNKDHMNHISNMFGLTLKNKQYVYYCEKNLINNSILCDLGFYKIDGTIEMSLDMLSVDKHFYDNVKDSKIQFHTLEKGKQEGLRCKIQNEIFNDNDRVPLSVRDMFREELEDYYYERGAIFIKIDNEYAGYGQIIVQDNIPQIVNFGIISKHRNKGYGKYLLKELLSILKNDGYTNTKLKVSFSNLPAINLYKKMGFTEISEVNKWQKKR